MFIHSSPCDMCFLLLNRRVTLSFKVKQGLALPEVLLLFNRKKMTGLE